MRLFLVQALVLTVIVLLVAAVLFRSGRARTTLHYIRDGILLYVLAIVGLGLWTYFNQQF